MTRPLRSLTAITALSLLSLSLLSLPLFAAAADKNAGMRPYTAIYQAVYKNFPLQATHRLEPTEGQWNFSSIASGFFGQIEENSTFAVTGNGIMPLHYLYTRNVLGHDRSTELTYNQTDKLVAGQKGDKSFQLALQGGDLDPGTYVLALKQDVAQGKTESCYKVIEDREVDQYCFKVTGKETLETALGKLDTVVVERVRKANSPRRTRFWLAPSLDYTIARLEHQEKKGETAYSLEITYYRLEPPAH